MLNVRSSVSVCTCPCHLRVLLNDLKKFLVSSFRVPGSSVQPLTTEFVTIPPSYSHLQASIYKQNCRRNFSFSVCSKCYYSISVRLTVILTIEIPTSERHLSKETNTMHIIQMAQEQHAIYFGYDFLDVLGKFYRNRKGISKGYY